VATGDIRIDALVDEFYTNLATNHAHGTGAVITYSFMSAAPTGSDVYDFRALNDAQKAAVRSMLTEVSSTAGVTFQEIAGTGVLQYGMYTGRPGIPTGPDNKAESVTNSQGSIVWLNWKVPELANLASGQGRQYVLHETGHSLGLKHPGAYSGYDHGPYLPVGSATAAHTIMAYNGGNTEHFGDYDVLALQYLYGGVGSPVASNIPVVSTYTNGTFFNDTFDFDLSKFTGPARVDGGAGIDTLVINISSDKATFKSGLKEFTYKTPDGGTSGIALDNLERVRFADKTVALDIDGNAGQAYRLYKAAFDRTPDKEGLSFWIAALDKGASIDSVAQAFVVSSEFKTLNGQNPSNLSFASSLYQHVLGRLPDQSGLDFWVNQLNNGLSKSQVLYNFSESTENKIALTGQVQNGIEYIA
jgi:hypothetical protein